MTNTAHLTLLKQLIQTETRLRLAAPPLGSLDLLEHVANSGGCRLFLVHEEHHAVVARGVAHGKVERVAAADVEARFKIVKVSVLAQGVT